MKIQVKNLNFSYGKRRILKDINFSINKGELVSIIGPNGVGKTTMFRCLLGINNKYTGDIFIEHTNIKSMSPTEMSKKIAYIPQEGYTAFNYSVLDMVLMGTASQLGMYQNPGKKQIEIAKQNIEEMGISHLMNSDYIHLSGGEKQLTLMARAISQQAKIFIMDEPTSNMDYGNQLRVMTTIKKLTKQGITVIQAIHSPEQAFMFSNHIIAMQDGKILADGSPKETITPSLIEELYNVPVDIKSINNDTFRVFIPKII